MSRTDSDSDCESLHVTVTVHEYGVDYSNDSPKTASQIPVSSKRSEDAPMVPDGDKEDAMSGTTAAPYH